MSKDNVEDVTNGHDDKKHCKDCHYYDKPKCKHTKVNDFTARKNSCAYHTPKKVKTKKGK